MRKNIRCFIVPLLFLLILIGKECDNMATIADKVQQIRTAVYGTDVRESIATGIEAINTEVESITGRQATVEGRQDDVENTFQEVINLGGNPSAEVVQARTDTVNSITYDNLQDRLDANASSLADIPKLTDTFTSARKVRFIAHRGLSAICPENTLPAWEMAGKCGVWGGETDIYPTSDGVWVVMHDTTVDRMTNGTGNVSSLTLAEIKALNIDSGNNIGLYPNLKVPTFEEYLICCKKNGIVPVPEIKAGSDSTAWDNLIATIRKHGFEDSIILISFDYNALQEIRNRSNKIMLQYLASINTTNINSVLALGNCGLDVLYSELTKENIELAHQNGILVNTWTVDSYQTAKTLSGYGVDFITTNIITGVI